MAYTTVPYFSNSIVGLPNVGADVDISAVDATQKFALGTRFNRQDGNQYAYGYSSAGAAVGKLMASTFASASVTLISNAVIAPASAVAVAGDTMKPGDIGSKFIEITKASVTVANVYAGGYLVVGSGTGLGQSFRIKSSTITGNPASGNIRIGFYESITTALDATSDVTITGNPFADVIVKDGTNYVTAGVSVSTTTTAKPYGWFLTKGVTGVLQDNTTLTLAVGMGVAPSPAVAGAVVAAGNAATDYLTLRGVSIIGECIAVTGATAYATVRFFGL
jgi:hypothetical protein